MDRLLYNDHLPVAEVTGDDEERLRVFPVLLQCRDDLLGIVSRRMAHDQGNQLQVVSSNLGHQH